VIACIGATSWGATLSWVLARNGHAVRVIARNAAEARAINETRRVPRMASLELPASVVATSDARAALIGVDAVLCVVPSQTVRENARRIAGSLAAGTLVVHATKGLERGTAKRVSEMLCEELPNTDEGDVCVLSGPNLAPEIVRGLPAATVIAGTSGANVERAQRLFHGGSFRVYASDDLAGVELAGSLKNVVAIVAGIADGLAFGDNAKAGIITRALAEITRLGIAAGAKPATFAGLAGVGDVMATCYSTLSRNRTFGEAIGRGASVAEALAAATGVVEGIDATASACTLSERLDVEMPIAESLRDVLFSGATPAQMIARLLQREPTRESG
jgi:glycerol-3-phosphate dehydrogenase (NAD(P)+)